MQSYSEGDQMVAVWIFVTPTVRMVRKLRCHYRGVMCTPALLLGLTDCSTGSKTLTNNYVVMEMFIDQTNISREPGQGDPKSISR